MFAVLAVIGMMAHPDLVTPAVKTSAPSATTHSLDLSSPALFPAINTSLPDNVEGPASVLGLMRDMWNRSPTFRRQCARLAGAANGSISIDIRNQASYVFRAATHIESRIGGKWHATIAVYLFTDLVELIAHEFEHIIEQLDGIDLVRLQQQGIAGVTEGRQHFETARAFATGKRVAQEYAHPPKQNDLRAERQAS